MPLYHVRIKEVWEQVYEVDAESPQDALDIWSIEGKVVEDLFEYSHTLTNDDLDMVEEVGEGDNTHPLDEHEQDHYLKGDFPVPQSLIEKANRHED